MYNCRHTLSVYNLITSRNTPINNILRYIMFVLMLLLYFYTGVGTSYDTILTPVVRYRNKCNETATDKNNSPIDNATDHSLKA